MPYRLDRVLPLPAILLSVLWLGGCAPTWQFAYDEAVRQARDQERDLFVFYKDPMDTRSSRMRDVLKSSSVRPLLNGKVRCMLVPFYGPNRRFVAQYGVDEPPALIVIHADGTYHALAGLHNEVRVRSFLESAVAPGMAPTADQQVPQRPKLTYLNVYEAARDKAGRQNRRLVIVYKWWLNSDSTELIARMSRPEVTGYFSESVNCILDWDYAPNREHVAKYGVTGFPSVIIVEPDGRYRILKGLPSVEQLVRFAVSGHSGR